MHNSVLVWYIHFFSPFLFGALEDALFTGRTCLIRVSFAPYMQGINSVPGPYIKLYYYTIIVYFYELDLVVKSACKSSRASKINAHA